MSHHETKNCPYHWGAIDGCQVTEAKVICRYNQDRNGGVVGDGPWDYGMSAGFKAVISNSIQLTVKEIEEADQEHR